MRGEVFLDTAYVIALVTENDDLHYQAVNLSLQLETLRTPLVTTRAVLLEIGNALAKRAYRQLAIEMLYWLEVDTQVEVVPLSERLYAQALRLYRTRPDKDWGLVDCISFIVMWDRGITAALTADKHFRQGGFQTLLQDDAA